MEHIFTYNRLHIQRYSSFTNIFYMTFDPAEKLLFAAFYSFITEGRHEFCIHK